MPGLKFVRGLGFRVYFGCSVGFRGQGSVFWFMV